MISGDDMRRFYSNIGGFYSHRLKQSKLLKMVSKKSNPNKIIPNMYCFLKKLRDKISSDGLVNYNGKKGILYGADCQFMFVNYLRKNIDNRKSVTDVSLRNLLKILSQTVRDDVYSEEREYIKSIIDNYTFSEITNVDFKSEKIEVYDYVVPDSHSFIANGFVNHNTRVLTQRTIKLLEDGVPPEEILAITFTNKAAKEMKNRIKLAVGEDLSKRIFVSTFHSMGAKILRKEVAKLPYYDRDFSILDTEDQKTVIKRGIDNLGLVQKGRKNRNGVDVYSVLSKISAKKDKLETDEEFSDTVDETTFAVYQYYKDYLLNTNCMDFGDLLYIFYKLLKHKGSVRRKYSDRFKFIMVDECQDLNFCQYEIVNMLSSVHGNLMLIGDIDQSIYRFRQADPKHVGTFLNTKEVSLLPLSYNYRSTKNILRSADALIRHNSGRTGEKLETVNDYGNEVGMACFNRDLEESKWVAKEIYKLANQMNLKYSDFAILYRTNALSRSFEQSLRMLSIPCKIIGGKSFFDLVVVKTAIAYLHFYNNPNNVLSFVKVINKPRRAIGEEIVKCIEDYCIKNDKDIVYALENIDDLEITGIGVKRKNSLHQFYNAMKKNEDSEVSVFETAERIFKESGYFDYIQELDALDEEKDEKNGKSGAEQVLESFMSMLKEWDQSRKGGLSEFLEYVNLQTSVDEVDNLESVKMMTMHTSKGLEFPVVFVVGVEDGIVPHKLSIDTHDPIDIEEERRLFYVGMTRAEKQLYITYSNHRMNYGKLEPKIPSRFLREVRLGGAVRMIRNEE
jgi:DNA helicase-2/ATP-dependent DNA helicase PcrA